MECDKRDFEALQNFKALTENSYSSLLVWQSFNTNMCLVLPDPQTVPGHYASAIFSRCWSLIDRAQDRNLAMNPSKPSLPKRMRLQKALERQKRRRCSIAKEKGVNQQVTLTSRSRIPSPYTTISTRTRSLYPLDRVVSLPPAR